MTLHSAHTMSSERFHKAAKDGALDILKEATRKDANTKDGDGMTPVLWAAFEGRLDALRLLAGKGGDPDKCDQFGNTALHLSSAKGHIHCVDFLLKFGVNIYALDIDRHSAKDLAAINNRDDVLRYLDSAIANLETIDRRKAKSMKEIAEKNCEKRIKDYVKRQQRIEHDYENMKSSSHRSGSMLSALKHKIWSSQGNLNKATKDSGSTANNDKLKDVVVGGSVASRGGVVQKKAISSKLKHQMHEKDRNDDHSFLDIDNKLCLSSLNRLHRDTEALYMGTFSSNEDSGSRAKITDIFDSELNSDTEKDRNRFCYGALSRSFSQPDFLAAQQDEEGSNISVPQRQSGLFDRPMLGSVAFRQSVTAALNQLHPEASSIDSSNSANTSRKIGSMTKSRSKSRSFLDISDTDSEGASFSDDEDQEDSGSPIQRFLAVWCLEEYLAVFHKQQIDLDTLMLLTEADLKSLGLPLGPFRKLTFAIQERRNALSNPGPIQDSRL